MQSVKMEQLGKLAGGMAHEINTPLCSSWDTPRCSWKTCPRTRKVLSILGIIEKQAQICRRIVADFLSFSRHIESRMEEMDLNHSIDEVLDLVRHSFKQDWIEIVTVFGPGFAGLIGDKEKLQQVWINLLNNAVDSIGQDGTIWVTTRLGPQSRRVQVTVADNGSGIDPEDLKRVFEPFFTTKAPGGGTGLGLSVSFGIIQDHHGAITARSPAPRNFWQNPRRVEAPPGPGSVFLVELPVSPDEPVAETLRIPRRV